MIIKPTEQTPLPALFYEHLANKSGIPDGVVNVVTTFGSKAGVVISSHMDVYKVSFTGSTDVGRLVMQVVTLSKLKIVSLELEGKSPILNFDSVDVDTCTDLALLGILYNKGEICVAGFRVYVQEGIYNAIMKKCPYGDPFEPRVQQGPQVDKK